MVSFFRKKKPSAPHAPHGHYPSQTPADMLLSRPLRAYDMKSSDENDDSYHLVGHEESLDPKILSVPSLEELIHSPAGSAVNASSSAAGSSRRRLFFRKRENGTPSSSNNNSNNNYPKSTPSKAGPRDTGPKKNSNKKTAYSPSRQKYPVSRIPPNVNHQNEAPTPDTAMTTPELLKSLSFETSSALGGDDESIEILTPAQLQHQHSLLSSSYDSPRAPAQFDPDAIQQAIDDLDITDDELDRDLEELENNHESVRKTLFLGNKPQRPEPEQRPNSRPQYPDKLRRHQVHHDRQYRNSSPHQSSATPVSLDSSLDASFPLEAGNSLLDRTNQVYDRRSGHPGNTTTTRAYSDPRNTGSPDRTSSSSGRGRTFPPVRGNSSASIRSEVWSVGDDRSTIFTPGNTTQENTFDDGTLEYTYDEATMDGTTFTEDMKRKMNNAVQRLMDTFLCNQKTAKQVLETPIGIMSMFYDNVCDPLEDGMKRPFYNEKFTMSFLNDMIIHGSELLYLQPPHSPGNDTNEWRGTTVKLHIVPGTTGSPSDIQPKLEWTTLPGGKTLHIYTTSVPILKIHSILTDAHEPDYGTGLRDPETEALSNEMCILTLTSQGGDVHMFEANSTRERDDLADGLRNIIARLAFHLIAGDATASTELYKDDRFMDDESAGLDHELGDLPSLPNPKLNMNRLAHFMLD